MMTGRRSYLRQIVLLVCGYCVCPSKRSVAEAHHSRPRATAHSSRVLVVTVRGLLGFSSFGDVGAYRHAAFCDSSSFFVYCSVATGSVAAKQFTSTIALHLAFREGQRAASPGALGSRHRDTPGRPRQSLAHRARDNKQRA